MSKSDTAPSADFDFWEFVTCARCNLPFVADSGGASAVPFWVTECGHVLCSTHLKPDQSCAKCGAQDIQVAPLHRAMDRPMSDWFTAVPQSFDSVAYAARFQFDQLASLVRYYKRKCAQQRILLEKMKAETQNQTALRSNVENLQAENQRLREYLGESSDMSNANGKRRMHDFGRNAHSSPRSVMTPLGPDRLTLPPSHHHPSFSGGQHHSDDGPRTQHDQQSMETEFTPSRKRPGSRQFSEQFAYNPPSGQSQPIPPGALSHAQAHPVRQAHGRRQHAYNSAHTSMPPPAQPIQQTNKFKPSSFQPPARGQGNDNSIPSQDHGMPPPSLPQSSSSRHGHPPMLPPLAPTPRGHSASSSNAHRFEPPANDRGFGSRMSTPLPQSLPTQRFIPGTPSGRQRMLASTPLPDASSGSSLTARNPPHATSGGQRIPFVPGGSNAFG